MFRHLKFKLELPSTNACWFSLIPPFFSCQSLKSLSPEPELKNRLKREKEKKEGKKEFKEVLKSRDLDNVFEIQVGGKMRIF